MRKLLNLLALVGFGAVACATTLEKLSVDEMIQKSNLIVRGTVTDFSSLQRGNVIYTSYRVRVSQYLKGQTGATVDVLVPGGNLNGLRQRFAGTPTLGNGSEYVLFIWTSPKGLNHVLGLSQGVYDVKAGADGQTLLVRGPVDARFVDASGRPVTDDGVKMTLARLSEKIQAAGKTEQK